MKSSISINRFRLEIDETLQEEGYFIQQNGWVGPIENITGRSYKTDIDIFDKAVVFFDLDEGVMSNYMCSCKMQQGIVCKHLSALLFQVEKNMED